ncbi:hypothetical protein GCM10009801_16700 [Streptomyces albiaxialis]|uniref:Uncharacterized protein n=1 Tax=Streptomyces albiaxialis TaxID=329523 RepID=A0ABN2VPW6_9ACTN
MRARRHCRDHERLPEMSESLITWAAITLMTRRPTRRRNRPAERRDVAHGYVTPRGLTRLRTIGPDEYRGGGRTQPLTESRV